MNRTAALVIIAFVLAFLFYLNNRPGYRSHRSLLDDVIDTLNGRYGTIVGPGDLAKKAIAANGVTSGVIVSPSGAAPFDVNGMIDNILNREGRSRTGSPNPTSTLPPPPRFRNY